MRIPGYISRRTAISGCGIALPYRLRSSSVRLVNTHKNRYLGRLGFSPPFYVYGMPMIDGLKARLSAYQSFRVPAMVRQGGRRGSIAFPSAVCVSTTAGQRPGYLKTAYAHLRIGKPALPCPAAVTALPPNRFRQPLRRAMRKAPSRKNYPTARCRSATRT